MEMAMIGYALRFYMRENQKHKEYTYTVGQQVMVQQDPNRKYGQDCYSGPFEVVQVYDNGTLRLRQSSSAAGAVYQTWNIRNVYPYKA